MQTFGSIALLASLGIAAVGCQQETTMMSPSPATQDAVPTRAEDVRPLHAADRAPSATLRRLDGQPVTLSDLYAQAPTMLIFYRGGWCPYCNVQLGHLAEAEETIAGMGIQIFAISPDSPETLRESPIEGEHAYRQLSDSDMALAREFGIAFRVDAATVQQYRGFGIDLEKASGESHHLLPVPAVYLIDRDGMIRFAHWEADYKKRLSPDELIAAAKSLASSH